MILNFFCLLTLKRVKRQRNLIFNYNAYKNLNVGARLTESGTDFVIDGPLVALFTLFDCV